MIRLSIVSLFVICFTNCDAQNWLWARGSEQGGTGFGIAADDAGDIYYSGQFSGTIGFGALQLSSSGNYDFFLVKYDSNGNLIWGVNGTSTNYSRCFDIACDESNNLIASGIFSGELTIGPLLLESDSDGDVFIAKYSSSGTPIWAKKIIGSYAYDYNVAVDKSNNIYFTTAFVSSTLTVDSFTITNSAVNIGVKSNTMLLKLDSNGNALWLKSSSELMSSHPFDIQTDSDGNVYLTGETGSTPFFGITPLDSAYIGGYVMKLDSNGTAVWLRATHLDVTGMDLAIDNHKNVFVAGLFYFPLTINTTTIYPHPDYYTNGFIAKFDSLGNSLWLRGLQAAACRAIDVDEDGNCYLLGYLTWESNNGTFIPILDLGMLTLQVPEGMDPMFVARYNIFGEVDCAAALSSGGLWKSDIVVNDNNEVFIASHYYSTPMIYAGSDTLTYDTVGTGLFSHSVLAKYSCDDAPHTSVNSIKQKSNLLFYPNPTSNTISFSGINDDYVISIFNSMGWFVKSASTSSVSIAELPAGIYTIRLRTRQESYSEKFIKQ